jgi:hypothetical protein
MRKVYVTRVETGLPEERLAAATAHGRSMTAEQALEFCLPSSGSST